MRATMDRIVDSHHHIWRRQDLPWLEGPMLPRIFGPYEPIRRDYAIEEYLGDIESSGIAQSIYVQANWAPAQAVDEVAWVQAEADRMGYPHAIVGYADLRHPDVGEVLKAQSRFPLLRGIRMQLHWHEKEQYRFADGPAVMIGIGGHLTMPPLPHHRAYGSVPRRFDRIRPQQGCRVWGGRASRNGGCVGPAGPPHVRPCASTPSASQRRWRLGPLRVPGGGAP